jgi:enamidase
LTDDVSRLIVTNIAKIVTGRIHCPPLNADAVLAENGKIAQIGRLDEIERRPGDKTLDANGQILMPGLIDSHFHPAIGDWAPKFGTVGYLESVLHGGVTTIISQGELQIAGRPKEASGIKALAILAKQTYDNYRPYGLKIHAGTLLVDVSFSDDDFRELAAHGIRVVPELGIVRIRDMKELTRMTRLAKKYGMITTVHCGGTSIPGSKALTIGDIADLNPEILAHVNGGPTSPSLDEIKQLFATKSSIEIVYGGNLHAAVESTRIAAMNGALNRVILGTDAPTGSAGLGTLGIIRLICLLSSSAMISGAEAIALATGNTAAVFGLTTGIIEPGMDADFVVMDAAEGSGANDAITCIEAGNTPGISAVIIDGKIACLTSRFTPFGRRKIKVDGFEIPHPGFEEYVLGLRAS